MQSDNLNRSQTKVKRSVVFKAVVTDYFKTEVLKELKNATNGLEDNVKQIQSYLEKNNFADEEKKALTDEIKKIAAQKAILEQRSQEVEKLKDGDDYIYNVVEGFAQLEAGDDIRKKLAPVEIITKDFLIQHIRD